MALNETVYETFRSTPTEPDAVLEPEYEPFHDTSKLNDAETAIFRADVPLATSIVPLEIRVVDETPLILYVPDLT